MTGPNVTDFGLRLRELRRRRRLSVRELARNAELSASIVSALETGRSRDPLLSTIVQLCEALCVSLELLMRGRRMPTDDLDVPRVISARGVVIDFVAERAVRRGR